MDTYTYEIQETPPMAKIYKDGSLVDNSGPWESVSAAADWAMLMVSRLNAGLESL
jgi:hypothetical protein